MQTIQSLIDTLNAYSASNFSDAGHFYIADDDTAETCGVEYESGDVVIGYDYNSDEMSHTDADRLQKWLYDVAWPKLHSELATLNYHEVEELDGSGGGLYYGVTSYRAV